MRKDTMLLTAQEFIGTVMAAILGIMWFDLRKLPALIAKWRMEKDSLKTEILAELGTRIDDKDGGLITRDKHEDLCRIATLEQNDFLIEKFADMLDDKLRKNGFVKVA